MIKTYKADASLHHNEHIMLMCDKHHKVYVNVYTKLSNRKLLLLYWGGEAEMSLDNQNINLSNDPSIPFHTWGLWKKPYFSIF